MHGSAKLAAGFSGGALFHSAGDLLSPAGERGRLSILIYHRALAAPDPILHDVIDADTFERHMTLLRDEFNVLPLGEACARLARGALPSRAACITFDDGYADNEQVALPILDRLGLRATFFVSTGFSEGGIMFNDGVIEAVRHAPAGTHDLSSLGLGSHSLGDSTSRRSAIEALIGQLKYRPLGERGALVDQLAAALRSTLPTELMMRPAQIRRLHDAGMEIGGHTVNHPILAVLDEQQARAEIVGGKQRLEEITGAPVTLFAYPNGKPGRDYGPRDVELVRQAGFAAALSTTAGAAGRGSDLFQLPRFTPWDRSPRRFGLRLLVNCMRGAPA
jgi:peptidoglycan/xylan/chitin deacetylase (PgdA/CDA1 family)